MRFYILFWYWILFLHFSHVKYLFIYLRLLFSYMFMFFSFLPSSLINVTSRWLIILLIYRYIYFEINLFHNISASMSFHFSSLLLVFLFFPLNLFYSFSFHLFNALLLLHPFLYSLLFFVYSITIIIMIFLKIAFTFIYFNIYSFIRQWKPFAVKRYFLCILHINYLKNLALNSCKKHSLHFLFKGIYY